MKRIVTAILTVLLLVTAMQTAAYAAAPNEDEVLQAQVKAMSLEDRVAQMFFVRCPGETALTEEEKYHFGGYLFFASDFASYTPQQVRDRAAQLQAAANVPLLMGVDEEGGSVNRISKYQAFRSKPFASPRTLYRQGGLTRVSQDTAEKCDFLKDLGLNVNFAPVCDVTRKKSSFLYKRSLGRSAQVTAQYVQTVVTVMNQKQTGSVLKHFPGYGENGDTHTGMITDSRTLDSFRSQDFLPFQAGIGAGADAVLVSHNIVTGMDPDRPASLSPAVHQLLRGELGFDGIIITDDLVMQAIQKYTGPQGAAVDAVLAGNDMLCCTDYQTQIPAVLAAVRNGTIDENTINTAVLRILKWKKSLGLIA